MNLTQKQLQGAVLGFMAFLVLAAALVLKDVRNVVELVLFVLILVVPPFWLDTLTRMKFNPLVDSLNKKTNQVENFPLWMRVLIWLFVAAIASFMWSLIIPWLLELPLWIGRLAMNMGWKSMSATDGKWQYAWQLIFLGQYFVNFIWGWARATMNYNADKFANRFDYPDE